MALVFAGLLGTRPIEFAPQVSQQPRVWGDGLIDQSFADWCYPRRREDCEADELVFFHRNESSSQLGRPDAHWLIPHIQQAIDAHARWMAVMDERAAPLGRQGGGTRDQQSSAFDLYALTILERLETAARSERSETVEPRLDEAIVAAACTQINTAHIYPHLSWAHETLTAAAWLGVLISRRPAWLPVCIAETLLSYGEDAAMPRDGRQDACVAVVSSLLARAGGAPGKLETIAKRVRERGRPALVHPPSRSTATRASHLRRWARDMVSRVAGYWVV